MDQMNNPLRVAKRPLPLQNRTSVSAPVVSPESSTAAPAPKTREVESRTVSVALNAEVVDPAVKAALELLASKGIAVAQKKKVFVKHTYELEESLFKEFHEMYSLLGYKTVKEAVNEVFTKWCDSNREEFKRRKGSL